ncbi:hypothetical protein BH24ACT10_BH24ACT10_09720 [soil metagenome]
MIVRLLPIVAARLTGTTLGQAGHEEHEEARMSTGSGTARQRAATALAGATALVVLLGGCAAGDRAIIGQSEDAEVGTVTLQSDASTAEVEPICVGDLPEDFTACAGAPQNLGAVELDETRKATLAVPLEVATGGYRVLVDGEPLPGLDGILNERNQVLRVPEAA